MVGHSPTMYTKKEVRNQYRELEQEYANISQTSNCTYDQTILFLVQNESAVQSAQIKNVNLSISKLLSFSKN